MRTHAIASVVLTALAAAAMTACGLSGVRGSQDWSGVTDARLYLACQVGGYGSGVLLSVDDDGATVLTCAHLVELGDTVDIHFRDEAAGRWVEYEGRVTRTTHPHKEDIALVRITTGAFHLPPQIAPISGPVTAGETFTAALTNVAFGAEERPFVLDLPAFVHTASVESFRPDEDGRTAWKLPKILVHGGLTQANSGSPVFRGPLLVGLAESAPSFANAADGALRTGVQVGDPGSIRALLK